MPPAAITFVTSSPQSTPKIAQVMHQSIYDIKDKCAAASSTSGMTQESGWEATPRASGPDPLLLLRQRQQVGGAGAPVQVGVRSLQSSRCHKQTQAHGHGAAGWGYAIRLVGGQGRMCVCDHAYMHAHKRIHKSSRKEAPPHTNRQTNAQTYIGSIERRGQAHTRQSTHARINSHTTRSCKVSQPTLSSSVVLWGGQPRRRTWTNSLPQRTC